MSAQDDDGLIDLICMNTKDNYALYSEDKYWNPALKSEFMDKIMNYWTPDLVGGTRREERERWANKEPTIIFDNFEQDKAADHPKLEKH